ncbi:cation diffusion facilitator family transporter [Naumannella cuiyingiana]|uniref:Cobalt-zinc-cadmium efflux system protein n=1 Tax=Naumannella cuiyingiana TaxID=1347891 RepID=A0A7Z0D909_9ACTN|nr:cation diffusion facilitator family transporter [Naumannella cuiyingiana]NYI71168.1 cobalt-zinc-cadmium efflux system protein [Naumannella cuiyingiana]
MGSGHSHAPAGHAGGRNRWRLQLSFGLVLTFFVVELVFGIISNSLALISDAGHMAADVVALGAALVATKLASTRDETGKRTYGWYRAEIFASGLAVLLMLIVSISIGYGAVDRIGKPEVEVNTMIMFVVGGIGLLINIIALLLLRGGSKESLNVKGAYLEVMADTLGSVGVIVAGVLVQATGQALWDTLIGLAIAIFVAVRAIMLGREVLHVLSQGTPDGIDVGEVTTALESCPGVQSVHDLHLWTLTSGMNVATAHLVTDDGADAHSVLDAAREVMRTRFAIEHATLQVEPANHQGCDELAW